MAWQFCAGSDRQNGALLVADFAAIDFLDREMGEGEASDLVLLVGRGHGRAGFDAAYLERAIERGFVPDVLRLGGD